MTKHQKEQDKPVKKSPLSPVHPSVSTTLLQPTQSSQNLSQVSQPLRTDMPPVNTQNEVRIIPADSTSSLPSALQHWQAQEQDQSPLSYQPLPSNQPSLPSQSNLSPSSDSSYFLSMWKVYGPQLMEYEEEEQKQEGEGIRMVNKNEKIGFLSKTSNTNTKNNSKAQSKLVFSPIFSLSSQKQQIIQNDDLKNKIEKDRDGDRDRKLHRVQNKIQDKQVGSRIQKKQKEVKQDFDNYDQGNQQQYQDQSRKRIRSYYIALKAKQQKQLMQRLNVSLQNSQSKVQSQPEPSKKQDSIHQNSPPPSPRKQSSNSIQPPPSSPILSPSIFRHQKRTLQNMNFLGRKLRELNQKKEQMQINQYRETETEKERQKEREIQDSEIGLGERRPKKFKVEDEEIYIDIEGLGEQKRNKKKMMMDLERQMEMEMEMQMEHQEELVIKFGQQYLTKEERKLQIQQYQKYELEKKIQMEMEGKNKKNL